MVRFFFQLSFLVFVMIYLAPKIHSFSNKTDKLALLDLKEKLGSSVLSSWNESSQFCQWEGVVCDKSHQRVVSLQLDSRGLVGSLPRSIGNLTALRRIHFGNNKIRGSIPNEMGLLERLQYLNLVENSISGRIPVELMNCSELEVFRISSNNISGRIPFEVGNLLKLRSLILDSNSLSGSIPSSIGYLSQLQHLWIRGNELTGSIPPWIGNLSSLLVVSLASNFFEGEIPSEIGKLKNLTWLHLYDNRLSGTIPAAIYNLSSVIEISVATNNLHGEFIPTSELNVPRLEDLLIGNNQFSGSIPAALLNISTLAVFDATSNNLTGQVPGNMGVLENLRWFNVEFNSLGSRSSGDLKFLTSLGNVSSLSIVGLQVNQFGGELPASFFNGTAKLTELSLGANRISGRIPDEIGKQTGLIQLGLEYNSLEGVIPEAIGNLVLLKKLKFHGNKLTGNIPDSLGNLGSLFFLSFDNNNLEGGIPLSLRRCSLMQYMLFSRNKMSGEIPKDFISHFGQLIELYLHQNMFTGSLPSEVGNLKNLGKISLSDNKFSGEIPPQLGECIGLEFVDISGNYLEGSIPSSLSKLKGLQFLDVSRNKLSGRIPAELESLNVMWYLNLSFNNFEGPVPTDGVFGNYSGFLFEENGKLCGGIPQLHLPRCALKPRKMLSALVIVLISVACVSFSALVIACVVLYWRRKARRESTIVSSEEKGLMRVSYKDLHDATSGFDSSNIIGVGSFGSVYKGFLFGERKPVAVKVLNLEKHGALKAFETECRSLGTIRHRNLLKILTVCSSIDYKGNEFMALVFELMPNGSLENWLHESRSLSLVQRLDIAIDIASALEYLHCGCDASIVHCDLKPNNVLLDQDMVAHVGDFGLAKVLFVESEGQSRDRSSSYAVKGSIGYIPPEYGMGAKVSLQGDVYSFGILVLEMITGMRPTSNLFTEGVSIHEYVNRALPDYVREIIDLSSLEVYEGEEVGKDEAEKWKCLVSMLEIGLACSAENPSERMDISEVLKALLVLKTRLFEGEGRVRRRYLYTQ